MLQSSQWPNLNLGTVEEDELNVQKIVSLVLSHSIKIVCLHCTKEKNTLKSTNSTDRQFLLVNWRLTTTLASLFTDALKKVHGENPTLKSLMGVNPYAKFTLESY